MPRRSQSTVQAEVTVIMDGGYKREYGEKFNVEVLKEKILEALVQRTDPGSKYKFIYCVNTPRETKDARDRYEHFKSRLISYGITPLEIEWKDAYLYDFRKYVQKFSPSEFLGISKRANRFTGFVTYLIGRLSNTGQVAVLTDCRQTIRCLEIAAQLSGKCSFLFNFPDDSRSSDLQQSFSPELLQVITLEKPVDTAVPPPKENIYQKKWWEDTRF